jgi:O-antigen ligase
LTASSGELWSQGSITIISIGILALVYVGAQNKYLSRFWRYWTDNKPRRKTYLEYIAFQQRFVYAETAIRIFDQHPIFGVGPGNYAFYFDSFLPDRQYARQPEIIRQITPVEGRVRLITPKNLYAKLLAETGLIGTITFTTFILAIIGCMLFLWFSKQPFWGFGSLFGVIVFLIVMFSFDSFALPNMWVIFGLITAAAHLPDSQETEGTVNQNE